LREALFIKKNKDRWEKVQGQPSESADEMARDFTRLVDDLAYAKTFYPTSKVTQFINSLASRIYLSIYSNRKEESSRLVSFWKSDLPLVIRKHHLVLLFSFIVFCIFFALGFFSSMQDAGFVRAILGDTYVDMTEENIATGNPFGVYQTGTPFVVWLGIMFNNMIVAFTDFAKGILFGVLSLVSVIKFGIMVGTFDYMFYAHGYGELFIMTVMIHGTLEISAFILAASSGIIMGKSFLFPGTVSRLSALKTGAKEGMKILVGAMPLLAIAAVFEGFVTRHYRMHPAISISILVLSAFFVIWYFVVYPIRLQKKLSVQVIEEEV
jgi:uncharacterized membrane protein SpoIIM required for sporulation